MSIEMKRHGEMYQNANYKQFMHLFCSVIKVDMAFNVSDASPEEYAHFKVGGKNAKLFFCQCRLTNFFPFRFVGSGFGRTDRHSRWAACFDLAKVLEIDGLLTKGMVELAENNIGLAKKDDRMREWKDVGTRVNSFRNFLLSEKIPSDLGELTEDRKSKFFRAVSKFIRKMKCRENNAAVLAKVKPEAPEASEPEVHQQDSENSAASKSLKREHDTGPDCDVASPPTKLPKIETELRSEVAVPDLAEQNVLEEVVDRVCAVESGTQKPAEKLPEQPAEGDVISTNPSDLSTEQPTTVIPQPTTSATATDSTVPVITIDLDDIDKTTSDSEDSYISIIDEPEIMGMNQERSRLSVNAVSGASKGDGNKRVHRDHEIGVTTQTNFLSAYEQIKKYKNRYSQEFEAFNKRIWDHYLKNGQNDYTFAWKMRAREMIHGVIRQIFPNSQLVVVGSTLNGCGSFNSDLDMCLCVKSIHGYYDDSRNVGLKILGQILKYFAKTRPDFLKDLELIRAKVPILKFYMHAPYEELEIDLNCNNTAGIYNTHLMHHYARIDDRFGALCLLVKHWAIVNDIQDAMNGTFNSYSLILMVLHFLQCGCSPPVLPNLQFLFKDMFTGELPLEKLSLFQDLPPWPRKNVNTQTIGELLIGFFEYYSEFDFDSLGISILRGDVFHRTDLPESSERFKLYVEEPFDGQNTARCITKENNFNKILKALMLARNAFLDEDARPPSFESMGIGI